MDGSAGLCAVAEREQEKKEQKRVLLKLARLSAAHKRVLNLSWRSISIATSLRSARSSVLGRSTLCSLGDAGSDEWVAAADGRRSRCGGFGSHAAELGDAMFPGSRGFVCGICFGHNTMPPDRSPKGTISEKESS